MFSALPESGPSGAPCALNEYTPECTHGQEAQDARAAAHHRPGRTGEAALSRRFPQSRRSMAQTTERRAGLAAQGDHAIGMASAARGKEMTTGLPWAAWWV